MNNKSHGLHGFKKNHEPILRNLLSKRRSLKSVIGLYGLIILVSSFWFLISALVYCQEVTIDVTKQKLTKIKTGISDFSTAGQSDNELAKKLTNVLTSDLSLVDYFEPIKSTVGVDLIIKCTYTLNSANEITIEGKVYETKKGQMLLGKRYTGPSSEYRKLVHSLTDSIITNITGEKGITQTKFAFEGNASGLKQIFICDFDGANLSQLTKDPCPSLFPNWSPDGNNIVYTSYVYNFPQTFIYHLKSNSRNKICGYPGLNTSANFSPDGRKIALTLSKDGNPEIYTINIDGSGLTRITNDKSVDTAPTWSPDGRKIAFVSSRSGTPQIYIVDSQGGTPRRLTYTGSYNANPNWSPRGDLIVYNSQAGGSFQIFTVDVNTGDSIQITNTGSSCENPSFAPDGRHIVFSLKEGYNYNLCLTDIFFREIHKLIMSAPKGRDPASGGKGGNCTNPDWGYK